jgi:N-acyl-L-homoserine lactone synthetase
MHVHVVTAANRPLYVAELEAMHRHRHAIFAEHYGWRALQSADGLDIDEFDTPHTVYLLTLDEDGALRGCDRLNPSWRPHMLTHLFPEYAQQEIPTGPGIWEWSRHAPGHPAWPEPLNRFARLLSSIALLEFAASRGVEGYTGILEARALPMAMRVGWRPRRLGAPVRYDEGEGVACLCPADLALLPRLRRMAGREDPVLIEIPARARARKPVELALRLTAPMGPSAEAAIGALLRADAPGA